MWTCLSRRRENGKQGLSLDCITCTDLGLVSSGIDNVNQDSASRERNEEDKPE